VLVDLEVEQRCDAVEEVLWGRATVTGVAGRYGARRRGTLALPGA
jgi:hypothetical protein